MSRPAWVTWSAHGAVWVCLLLGSCGVSSVEGTGAGEVEVVIDDPGGAFDGLHGELRQLIERTSGMVADELALADVTIRVLADPPRTIPGYGLGGYAFGANRVEIVLDPDFPGLDGVLSQHIPRIVAHELHHTVRIQDPGYGATLLENMISEGLATRYAHELTGHPLPPWAQAFPAEETNTYLERAKAEFDRTDFDFRAWFFGIDSDLPAWTGYTLGYRLVESYLAANPSETAGTLVGASVELFRPN